MRFVGKVIFSRYTFCQYSITGSRFSTENLFSIFFQETRRRMNQMNQIDVKNAIMKLEENCLYTKSLAIFHSIYIQDESDN